MKIAVCISGQIRTWRKCYKSWFLMFDELKERKYPNMDVEIDYFIHTWDFNTVPPHKWHELGFPNINWAKKFFKVDDSDLNEIIDIIKPIKYLIEDSNVSDTRKNVIDKRGLQYENTNGVVVSWASSQLYSIMRCGQLKRDYEIENNFEYDACVKLRFDGFISEYDRSLFIKDFNYPLEKKTIYSMHSRNLLTFPHDLVGDIFYFSNSQTYDILSSMYNWIPIIKEDIFEKGVKIEEVFGYYIRMFKIKNKRTEIDVKIIREDYENCDLF